MTMTKETRQWIDSLKNEYANVRIVDGDLDGLGDSFRTNKTRRARAAYRVMVEMVKLYGNG